MSWLLIRNFSREHGRDASLDASMIKPGL